MSARASSADLIGLSKCFSTGSLWRHHISFSPNLYLFMRQNTKIVSQIFVKHNCLIIFLHSLSVGCRKSSATQIQRRILNLAIIAGIKSLHSPNCTRELVVLQNIEQLRSCQNYRKMSFLPAFNPTSHKEAEIHHLSCGGLHNGNNTFPFGSPWSTSYLKKK